MGSLPREVIQRNLVFVTGKGGVGKTLVSQAVARTLAQRGKRALWVSIEDPMRPPGEFKQVKPNLWHLNADPTLSFEEYVTLKIGAAKLAAIFIQNKLMRYLSKAAPGIHELVLLGKIWHERLNYDHVVVDMPSTGYGLAMFQSTANFATLFRGGPIHRDAELMLSTFGDPAKCGFLIVALPEEMPLRESMELSDLLKELFPGNPAAFIANRKFPQHPGSLENSNPDTWKTPLAESGHDYALKRNALESYNLRLWRDAKLEYSELPYIPPPFHPNSEEIVQALSTQIEALQ